MSTFLTAQAFPRGLLAPELFLGVVSSVAAQSVGVNLTEAGRPSGAFYRGARYGRGEVGELVLIEGQQSLLLGRIREIRLPDPDRRSLTAVPRRLDDLDAIGNIQLLGCVALDTLEVTAGVDAYPRLGDRIYAAPHRFVALLPQLMRGERPEKDTVALDLGTVGNAAEAAVSLRPEKLFGRHCAILGTTGGGKSWTTARIIQECLKYPSKVILLDATGEYRGFDGPGVKHCHLGAPLETAAASAGCSLPPTSFLESDFVALFEPAGKVQGPKLRAAIRSLRLANLVERLAPNGFIEKIGRSKRDVEAAERRPEIAASLDDPRQGFDARHLVRQIEQECVYPDAFGEIRGQKDLTKWGLEDGNFSHCLPLVARINGVLTSPAFRCVFHAASLPSLTDGISEFHNSADRLLRLDLSGIHYEFNAREIIANVVGRHLLELARSGAFRTRPAVVLVDEAHNFLGRHIGTEDYASKLDAFELIAKEGRKYGLCLCLATQRPRDITEGVISQMGTLIVHRLTNDRDREVVERACGEIDRSASAFLPNLRPGEAVIIGTDFPIPLMLQILEPSTRPNSEGPAFQKHWKEDISEVSPRDADDDRVDHGEIHDASPPKAGTASSAPVPSRPTTSA